MGAIVSTVKKICFTETNPRVFVATIVRLWVPSTRPVEPLSIEPVKMVEVLAILSM